MGDNWYSRPILYAANLKRTLDFYIGQLGFDESWRYDEGGATQIVQVERLGCELIFSCQDRMKAGAGRIFISLDLDVLEATRRDYEAKGIAIRDGYWGYKTMIIADPDGNELFFPYPADHEG
ncbi:MAG: VOC family protein [Hyphomonadaceae bacterium]|nr:VOC family protein [Hyphomonadaceae bacterium]